MAGGKQWTRGTRIGIAAPSLLAGAIACGDPSPENSQEAKWPPSLWVSQATITIDASHPNEPPAVLFVVTAGGDGPQSFSADALELFGAGSEPLVTIHGGLEPKTPLYSNGHAGPTYFMATDL